MSRVSIAAYFPFCGVKVVGQSVPDNARSALIHLEPDLRYRPVCHVCGRPGATIHSDGYCRIVRDLNLASADTWLKVRYINRVRHHCPEAKIVFDFFHVVSAFGFVVDEIRRSEYRKAHQEDKKVTCWTASTSWR